MKRKILHTAIVAIVMGAAIPVHAESGEPIYYHNHYDENWNQVGQAKDYCRLSGVLTQWQWGIGSDNVDLVQFAVCTEGVVGPIE